MCYNKRAKVIDEIFSLSLVVVLMLGLALGFRATEAVRCWLSAGVTCVITIGGKSHLSTLKWTDHWARSLLELFSALSLCSKTSLYVTVPASSEHLEGQYQINLTYFSFVY